MIHLERQYNRSSHNRPYTVRWFNGWRNWGFHLSWGNRNTDCVWSIGVTVVPHSDAVDWKPCVPVACPQTFEEVLAARRPLLPELNTGWEWVTLPGHAPTPVKMHTGADPLPHPDAAGGKVWSTGPGPEGGMWVNVPGFSYPDRSPWTLG